MRRVLAVLTGFLLLAPLTACAQEAPIQPDGGLSRPLDLVHAGDGSGRLFAVEQGGLIRVVRDGEVVADPFLDLRAKTNAGGEQGLLGLAFHPDYAENGLLFVNYTDPSGATTVERYAVSDDPDRADPESGVVLLTVPQPFGNHNGGDLAFGPDGYLYIALGDGGSGGDPQGNGQNLGTLLGSLLRIDVDGGEPYAIPDDNPFVDLEGARPEIWAYGLRNPWRFSFDRETGDLFIGDVGQNAIEEIDHQPADAGGGQNYGWNTMEGDACYQAASCDRDGLVLPILTYGHDLGNSVTGGYVYRGEAAPSLVGAYVFADFASGRVWAARADGGAWTMELIEDTGFQISSFGEDEAGELYFTDLAGGGVHAVASLLD